MTRAALVIAVTVGVGCSTLPTAPSPAQAAPPTHGLAVVVDSPLAPGQIAYVCATQPRSYCIAGGACRQEIDHYVADNPCPPTPIE